MNKFIAPFVTKNLGNLVRFFSFDRKRFIAVIVDQTTRKHIPVQIANLNQIALLENVVNQMAVAEARKLLAGYPFSITGVFAFYLLLRIELKNLIALFAGKESGLNEEAIRKYLYGLG